MKKSLKATIVASVAAFGLAISASAAHATVTFDPGTGRGFAGKGDIQVPFGWSNAQLQANASYIEFRYISTFQYTGECEYWFEGQRFSEWRYAARTAVRGVKDAVVKDTRKNSTGAVTGFNLSGFAGKAVLSGDTLLAGTSCTVGQSSGTIVNVNVTSDEKVQAYHMSSTDPLTAEILLETMIWRNGASIL